MQWTLRMRTADLSTKKANDTLSISGALFSAVVLHWFAVEYGHMKKRLSSVEFILTSSIKGQDLSSPLFYKEFKCLF